IRTRAEEEEQEAAIEMPLVAGLAAAVGQAGQMLLTVQRDDVGRRNDFDIRMLFQPLDQIFGHRLDRKSTSLNSRSLMRISYAIFCLKKKKNTKQTRHQT